MKNGRIIGIALAVMDVALAAACAVLYLGTDRKEPRFEFQDVDTVYQEGMEISALFKGITAFDNEDGDMTESIVIEKIMENREENTVSVFYAVSDKAGNVGKCSRKFQAVFEEDNGDGTVVEEEWLMQSGFWAELEGSREESDSHKNGETQEEGEASESADEEEQNPIQIENGENETENEERNGAENEIRDEAGNGMEDEIENEGEDIDSEPEGEENETAAGAPMLTLKVTEISIEAGQAPAWVDVIGSLSDDKDSYETLFSNLSVSGYDINQEGTYQAAVLTEDSDGNQSQPAPLTIIVR